ncbi:unnamed protein product [Paramecium sonneborni]|uniref:Uncharacterized protein n=1 Tax=Paramecium sonneborni TaxID=65129 RepID=A0A8S1RL95_9CILI|nr:unnamed protein product [Paramecium sonneborni]
MSWKGTLIVSQWIANLINKILFTQFWKRNLNAFVKLNPNLTNYNSRWFNRFLTEVESYFLRVTLAFSLKKMLTLAQFHQLNYSNLR